MSDPAHTGGALVRRAGGPPAPRGRTHEATLSRRLVLRALRGIDGGEIELREGGRSVVLGRPETASPLRTVIDVRSPRFYRQLLRGSVGLGESYVDGHVGVQRPRRDDADRSAQRRKARPPAATGGAAAAARTARGAPALPQYAAALAQADRGALRPRQRAVRDCSSTRR